MCGSSGFGGSSLTPFAIPSSQFLRCCRCFPGGGANPGTCFMSSTRRPLQPKCIPRNLHMFCPPTMKRLVVPACIPDGYIYPAYGSAAITAIPANSKRKIATAHFMRISPSACRRRLTGEVSAAFSPHCSEAVLPDRFRTVRICSL